MKKNYQTIGAGGFGKCRVYRDKYKNRLVVEKRVGDNFLRLKKGNRVRFTTLINQYEKHEEMLRKESIMMLLTKVCELDCCVEILSFKSNPFRIIMEYCEGGDLRKILNEYKVHDRDKIVIISQILTAIEKIHSYGFIHGDLKCSNIFLANKYIPGKRDKIKVKIGDFGLSEIGGNLIYGGTPGFYAPEIQTVGGSFESDIYSIGKVMLEIMTQLPISRIVEIDIGNINILKNYLPKFLNISEFYDLVIPCLYINPKKRPTARALNRAFQSLMLTWVNGMKMNHQTLTKYNVGDKIRVDIHEHPLILSNQRMRNYKGDGWICDICKDDDSAFLNNTLSFHCNICGFDLCLKCLEKHKNRYEQKKKMQQRNYDNEIYEKKKKVTPRIYEDDIYEKKKKVKPRIFDDDVIIYEKKKKVTPRNYDNEIYEKKKKVAPRIYDDIYENKKRVKPRIFDDDDVIYEKKKKVTPRNYDNEIYEKKKKVKPRIYDDDEIYEKKTNKQNIFDDDDEISEKKIKYNPPLVVVRESSENSSSLCACCCTIF